MEIEADVDEIASLQNLAQSCKSLLKHLLQDESSQKEDLIAQEGHWAMRQYVEFNLWCTKVGVDGQGLRSIDVRLKDVPEICWFIRSLLNSLMSDLESQCQRLLQKVHGANQLRKRTEIQQPDETILHHKMAEVELQDPDSDSCGSSLSFDSLSSLDDSNAGICIGDAIAVDRMANSLKEHVEDTIVRLHGHALQIDRATAKHRRERLNRYLQKDDTKMDYEAYKRIGLLRGAKFHFKSASEAFQERMADSLARRRVRFDYLEKHQKKRDCRPSNQQPGLPESSKPMAALQGERSEPRATRYQELTTHSSPLSGWPPKYQKTEYSNTVNTKLKMGSEVMQQERAESVISVAQKHSDFPSPPTIVGASFHCPYCRLDFRASEAKGTHWE